MDKELRQAHEEVYGFRDETVSDDGSLRAEKLKVYIQFKHLGIDIKQELQGQAAAQAIATENFVLRNFMRGMTK